MTSISIKAPAKINLTLDILGKRADGFHEIESLFQTINLCDYIFIIKTQNNITLSTDHPALTNDDKNIAFRAAQLMFDRFSLAGGVHIEIKKNIPLQAGLGGGSSDAAAVLKGLKYLYALDVSIKELEVLASSLGSDIPFFISGGTAFVAGRGERVTLLPDLPEKDLLLVTFPFGLSTKDVYTNWQPTMKRNSKRGFAASCYLKWEGVMPYVGNDLQNAACLLCPEIKEVLDLIEEKEMGPAYISGSGPSIIIHSNDVKGLQGLFSCRDIKVTPVKTLKKEF